MPLKRRGWLDRSWAPEIETSWSKTLVNCYAHNCDFDLGRCRPEWHIRATYPMDIPDAEYEKRRHAFELCRWINDQFRQMEGTGSLSAIYAERKGKNVSG